MLIVPSFPSCVSTRPLASTEVASPGLNQGLKGKTDHMASEHCAEEKSIASTVAMSASAKEQNYDSDTRARCEQTEIPNS